MRVYIYIYISLYAHICWNWTSVSSVKFGKFACAACCGMYSRKKTSTKMLVDHQQCFWGQKGCNNYNCHRMLTSFFINLPVKNTSYSLLVKVWLIVKINLGENPNSWCQRIDYKRYLISSEKLLRHKHWNGEALRHKADSDCGDNGVKISTCPEVG